MNEIIVNEKINNNEYDDSIEKFRKLIEKFKCIDINSNDIKYIKKENIKSDNKKKEDFVYPDSTSKFRKREKENMKIFIKIILWYSFDLKNYEQNNILKNIINFYDNTTDSEYESKEAINFIKKLKKIKNNIYETYVDDFIRILLQITNFDNGFFSIESQTKIFLKIGHSKISSIPDIICKTDNNLIVFVEESKHISNTYLHGDIQLICNMLSAYQHNYKIIKDKIFEKPIYGLKIKSTICYFYKMTINKDYFNNLKRGKFNNSIVIYKYPEKGIDIDFRKRNKDNIKMLFGILYFILDELNKEYNVIKYN